MSDIDALRRELEKIDAEIQDTEARLPAHSVKPPIMHALFELEDRRETIVAKLKRLGDTEAPQ